MDFGLSDEQRQLQQTIARFVAEQCPSSRVRNVMEGDSGHDAELWSGLAELGVFGLEVPAAYGGHDADLLELALVAEELGYGAVPGPFLGSAMATVALAESDDADLRAAWLPKLASGEAIATVAIGEAGGEWRADKLTASVRAGAISGEKPLVPYATLADFLVVAAADDDGPGLWLVESAAPGVATTPLGVNDLTRRLEALHLADAPATRIGGEELVERTLDAGWVLLAADAYGGARRCLDMTRAYVLEREQFGQVIGAFQGVKHQLADLIADLEPSLSLWWYAAHAFDHLRPEAPRHAAMAKAHLTDLFDRIARETTELHGGIGFTWEFDLHLWFRRAMFDRSFLGESNLLRQRAADLGGW